VNRGKTCIERMENIGNGVMSIGLWDWMKSQGLWDARYGLVV